MLTVKGYLMKVSNIAIIIFLIFLSSAICEAGDSEYQCVAKNVYEINNQGKLVFSSFQKQFAGSAFNVSKGTGAISGKVLTTDLAQKTRVINHGSKDNSYKAVAEFEGQIQLIEIQIFKEGSIKPFIASSMGGAGIVTGTCRAKE
jgi:hypothetical protein